MNPDFRLHYDRLRENDPTRPENGADEANTHYETPGHARHLCLVWPDGKRQFLSYSYLVGGTFIPGDEMNEITLNFSTYTVTIKGYGLEGIFAGLLGHLPKQLVQVEQRYTGNDDTTIVEMSAILVK